MHKHDENCACGGLEMTDEEKAESTALAVKDARSFAQMVLAMAASTNPAIVWAGAQLALEELEKAWGRAREDEAARTTVENNMEFIEEILEKARAQIAAEESQKVNTFGQSAGVN